ncbi:MAG: hypothetical protein CV045_01850 [Cyanobacteria bacterium M5B4]|nr:MAG: hypothetical protein CV045_01850 [Cyanobacteria bacterium M5B4]
MAQSQSFSSEFNTTLCIRQAEYLDTYAIGELLSLSFYPWGQWAKPLMDLLVALDVQSRFNEPNNFYLCTIAMVEGKVVASLEIALRLIPIGRVPYLFNLAVHPQWRRRGIGARLLRESEVLIASWNVPYLYLHVLSHNQPAQQLYLRSGFEIWQREKHWFRAERLLMRKVLK